MGIVPATRRLGRKTHCRESVGQRLPRSKISLCRPIRVATETGVCRDESERRKDNFRVDRDSRAIQKIRSPSAHLEHSLSDQAISHQVRMWQCVFLAPAQQPLGLSSIRVMPSRRAHNSADGPGVHPGHCARLRSTQLSRAHGVRLTVRAEAPGIPLASGNSRWSVLLDSVISHASGSLVRRQDGAPLE